MNKIYKYKNGSVYVTLPGTCDRDKLISATEEFLRKVIKGGYEYGNTNKSRNIREK